MHGGALEEQIDGRQLMLGYQALLIRWRQGGGDSGQNPGIKGHTAFVSSMSLLPNSYFIECVGREACHFCVPLLYACFNAFAPFEECFALGEQSYHPLDAESGTWGL